MKVLCPIDFSEASGSGMEYAANLTRALTAHLNLLYVRQSIWPEAVQLEREEIRSTESILHQLEISNQVVKKEFGISCGYEMEQTTDTVETTIAAKAKKFDLMVLGTNGADNIYQHVFGSNTFHVIEQTRCPVIIVPNGCAYRTPRSIVYAYDPATNPIFQINQLLGLSIPLTAEVKVLHILTEKKSAEAERRMEIMMEAVKAREKRQVSWSFDFQYAETVSEGLDQYVADHQVDMLALNSHHRTLLDNIFKENVLKQLSRVADYPVFVFWQ